MKLGDTGVRGIFYEAAKDRYRVRLYLHGEVIWRTYHATWLDALEAWKEAQEYRNSLQVHGHSLPAPKNDAQSALFAVLRT